MRTIDMTQRKRCAIYTRKSAEPPIGQEITSLESQRAICSAYIASQQHKGWIELDRCYDDSGRSGSNLNRPALQDLIRDVEDGQVEIVVVYKLDRITRTLLDFVRLIDFFDRHGVVFVAITQNFDTSDSMGRLIRNILLTFAQFEREIASDRMRDKKMVMKQRGLWTGGDAPIGYDLRKGRLVVNRMEEPAVRCIFDTYIETGRASVVHKRLIENGYRRKTWRSKSGVRRGGGPIGLSSLHHILRNPVYIGEVTHRGERFAGIHPPIIERSVWDKAQAVLKEREQFKPRQERHILTGLLFDAHGRRMHAREIGRSPAVARYYASARTSWAARQDIRPIRAQSDQLERLILEALKQLLSDRPTLRPLLIESGVAGEALDELTRLGTAAAVRLDRLGLHQLSSVMKLLISRVEIGLDCVRLLVRLHSLFRFIAWDGVGLFDVDRAELARSRPYLLHIPVSVDRGRRKSWLPIEPCSAPRQAPSPGLLDLIEDARIAQELLFQHRDLSVRDLAWLVGRKTASFSRLIRLNYLAPDIVAAIVDGTQPATLSRRRLLECDLPIDWGLQRRLLGFPGRPEPSLLRATAAGEGSEAVETTSQCTRPWSECSVSRVMPEPHPAASG